MPRPMFGREQQGGRLVPGVTRRATPSTGGRVSTTPRSARYRAAIGRLDASATLLPIDLDEIVDGLHREFAETWSAVPLGFVAHCYLGPPFEAHTLTVDGAIIEHYRSGQALPGPLEQARALARTEHYLVIEVYLDKLVAVRADGSVVTLGE
jgi:hypothetical protein